MFGGKICWCFEFLTCDNIRISCASSPTIYRYQVLAAVVAGNLQALEVFTSGHFYSDVPSYWLFRAEASLIK